MNTKTKLILLSIATIALIFIAGTAAAGGANGPDPFPFIMIN